MLKRFAAAAGALAALSAGCASRQPAPAPAPILQERAKLLEVQLAKPRAAEPTSPAAQAAATQQLEKRIVALVAQQRELAQSRPTEASPQPAPQPVHQSRQLAPSSTTLHPAQGQVLLVKFSPAFPEEKWRGLLERSLRDYAYRRFSEAGRELNEKTAGDGLIGKPPPQTIFLGPDGNFFNISQFRGRKRVVLIFLRGFPGYVCMSCSAQTTTLAEQEEEFKKRDAQVILVYPGHPDTVPTFLEATRNYSAEVDLPYPVLLDIDLAATERFGVKGNLVKPATVIIDKSGIIRYAYVGEKTYDRPAAADTIAELDKIRD